MKIWVIGRNYPTKENRMQGSFELEQAKLLACHGEKVTYLTCMLHPFRKIRRRGIEKWNEQNVDIMSISAFFLHRVRPCYFVKQRNKFWRKLFKAAEEQYGLPDVIHLHYPAMMMIGEVLEEYAKKGVRIFATEHWSKVLDRRLDDKEQKEFDITLSTLDACFCVSKELSSVIQERDHQPKRGVFFIPNVVNKAFVPVPHSNDVFQFVAVGRLVPIKQFDLLIDVFSRNFRGKKVCLSIIGDGEMADALRTQIRDLKMEDQIHLMGAMSRNDTARTVASSDCLCCTSKLETFGVPIIESWACGIPVIAFEQVAVMKEYSTPDVGVIVRQDDKEAFAEAMKYVMENREKYDSHTVSRYANENFSEETVYQLLKKQYQGNYQL